MTAVAINCGALAGGNFPTASLGVVFRGLIDTAYEAEPAFEATNSFVDEMKIFFHQTLVAMSETFKRATNDEKMADTMMDFCDYFAEKLELKK